MLIPFQVRMRETAVVFLTDIGASHGFNDISVDW
jgi:hypothetical protein